jgi:hypothetical protein
MPKVLKDTKHSNPYALQSAIFGYVDIMHQATHSPIRHHGLSENSTDENFGQIIKIYTSVAYLVI